MASSDLVGYSDDMIRAELLKLGITDVEPTLFEQIKADLREKRQELILSRSSEPSSIDSSIASISSTKTTSAVSITLDPEVEMRHRSRFQKASRGTQASASSSRLSTGNLSVPSNKENDPSVESVSGIPKMLKRKVLRKNDSGKKVITVELLPLPHYKVQRNENVTRGRSASTDELCSRMSSVSLCSKSSGSSEKSRCHSRQSGVIVPNGNIKRKKCDPVTRYHEYRKYWDTFKLPGENKHKDVRWTMRDKLMNYDFC